MTFQELNLNTPLLNALNDLGFENPTPIQEKVYPVVMSGRDAVGIAQTGTGKTFAYLIPILRQLKYSAQKHPRILVLSLIHISEPTRLGMISYAVFCLKKKK